MQPLLEAGGQPLEPHRRDMPVAIAPRTAQQIHLPGYAFDEGKAQLGEKRGVFTRSSSKSSVKSTGFVGHSSCLPERG